MIKETQGSTASPLQNVNRVGVKGQISSEKSVVLFVRGREVIGDFDVE